MIIIGCDYHLGFQQIAYVDTETGDCGERRLSHREEAEKFYRDLAVQGRKVRVGMEASGHARWFERLLAELNFELWIGDAAEIRARREQGANRWRRHSNCPSVCSLVGSDSLHAAVTYASRHCARVSGARPSQTRGSVHMLRPAPLPAAVLIIWSLLVDQQVFGPQDASGKQNRSVIRSVRSIPLT